MKLGLRAMFGGQAVLTAGSAVTLLASPPTIPMSLGLVPSLASLVSGHFIAGADIATAVLSIMA